MDSLKGKSPYVKEAKYIIEPSEAGGPDNLSTCILNIVVSITSTAFPTSLD